MITKEEVIKLANLARLDFSDDELDRIIKDMGHFQMKKYFQM